MNAHEPMDAESALVCRCVNFGGTLTFTPGAPTPTNVATVTLTVIGLTATRPVDQAPDQPFGILSFFESCARDWRGWEGMRSWYPPGCDVIINATHDGLGHITLQVLLEQYRPVEWRLESEIILEAGGLDALVRDAARFEAALPAPPPSSAGQAT